MKRFTVLTALLLALIMVGSVMAQTTPPPIPTPAPAPKPQPWPPRNTSGYYYPANMRIGDTPSPVPAPSDFAVALNNLSGDYGLIYERGLHSSMAPGVGLDVVNYKNGLVTLRAEAFFESPTTLGSQSASIVGGAFMVNLIQLAGLVPGSTWVATAINPSIGVFAGYDFVNGRAAYGPMLSVINVHF